MRERSEMSSLRQLSQIPSNQDWQNATSNENILSKLQIHEMDTGEKMRQIFDPGGSDSATATRILVRAKISVML